MINIDIKVLIVTCLIAMFWCWFGAIYILWKFGLSFYMFGILTLLTPITWVVIRQACKDWKS